MKNWLRLKNTIEYFGLLERLNYLSFKGVVFDPLLSEAGSNSFTMSPTRWGELTNAIGLFTKNGANGGLMLKDTSLLNLQTGYLVEFELYLVKEFQRLKAKEQKQNHLNATLMLYLFPDLDSYFYSSLTRLNIFLPKVDS